MVLNLFMVKVPQMKATIVAASSYSSASQPERVETVMKMSVAQLAQDRLCHVHTLLLR